MCILLQERTKEKKDILAQKEKKVYLEWKGKKESLLHVQPQHVQPQHVQPQNVHPQYVQLYLVSVPIWVMTVDSELCEAKTNAYIKLIIKVCLLLYCC